MKKTQIMNAPPSGEVLTRIMAALIGVEVPIRAPDRPVAVPLPRGIHTDDHWCVDNIALRDALTHKIGVDQASRLFGHLPLGQVKAIPKNCCSEPIEV